MSSASSSPRWQFWLDRGGTFTDIVAKRPDGQIVVHKLLSENPEQYQDAAIAAIRTVMEIPPDEPLPSEQIEGIKMGTTVATNALLERQGDRVVLLITRGFGDALKIGYQNRPDIFARQIVLPEMLYERVIEVNERIDAKGTVLEKLQSDRVRDQLQAAYNEGIRSCAIVLMHGYRYPQHERELAAIARDLNFSQVSVSHELAPLMKLVSRGDTTVIDAYLSPILHRYIEGVKAGLNLPDRQSSKLMFMQSNGGLSQAKQFQGKDSILSGPAGGIVGAVKTSQIAGFDKIIAFDMGGTSTDVAHYNGEYERSFENEIAGTRLRSPMMAIHTVAAGGGSIVRFDGTRYRVGPESAGADPGPAAYGKGGPLTITDCNVMLGKLQPEFFPKVFGKQANQSLDKAIVQEKFTQLAASSGDNRTPEAVAAGLIAIAVEKMASAIKKISLERGYDVSRYVLCCFGGAGGQHACLIAKALGINRVFLHPYAGVLSAYGIGLADLRVLREQAVERQLEASILPQLETQFSQLIAQGKTELTQSAIATDTQITCLQKVHLKYRGTDSPLIVNFGELAMMRKEFEQIHRQRYGFITEDKDLIVESIAIELICPTQAPIEPEIERQNDAPPTSITTVPIYTAGAWHQAPVYQRESLQPQDTILGPALIIEPTGTNVIETGWQARLTSRQHLILENLGSQQQTTVATQSDRPDPVLLEIFNNLFRAIADQMGTTLQNTSYSVNIKERLDFSCAIFAEEGSLVANAPHIPVHLGSMSESVRSLIRERGETLKPGDVYILNNPYNGGTHLPDITVITPVFFSGQPLFYVASRGHHADIGGIAPGSMPPNSTAIEQEGILFNNFLLVTEGRFRERELLDSLTSSPYPVRNPAQNTADLQAQIAANEKGVGEIRKMVEQFGLETVRDYMKHVQNNAEECVRQAISRLKNGSFTCPLDCGGEIQVAIAIAPETRSARIDFTGTSAQLNNNFNAPLAITKAAVLYVFRTLVEDNIPLNEGCLKPLEIIVPQGSLLDPKPPAAVVAGNVETSQNIVDVLYGALGIQAASQGTMNNFTFGSDRYQYYETICGGSGAGSNFHGTDAVQTHMTNSRLTDPEVLEWRFPVLLESFSIRANSGGKGKYNGGNGVIRRLRFLEPMTAAILSSRRHHAPFGLQGGEPGKVGKNYCDRQGKIEQLEGTAIVEMNPKDVLVIETPGGGGFGMRSTFVTDTQY